MKGFILDYINENEYHKLERALKKYNMLLSVLTNQLNRRKNGRFG